MSRLLAVVLVCGLVAACSGSSPSRAPHAVASPSPSVERTGDASAPPAWLGTRVLPAGSHGFATPPELRRRSIITTDDLPPPADGRFHSTIQAVPATVLARSTWTSACPVKAKDLRYVTVSFRGFDRLPHTGELLVHERAAGGLVKVFGRLFAEGYPIERMRVTSAAELKAPPTRDGNTTAVFACRPVRGPHTSTAATSGPA